MGQTLKRTEVYRYAYQAAKLWSHVSQKMTTMAIERQLNRSLIVKLLSWVNVNLYSAVALTKPLLCRLRAIYGKLQLNKQYLVFRSRRNWSCDVSSNWVTQILWQWIPDCWTDRSEGRRTKRAATNTWYSQLMDSGRSQMTVSDRQCRWRERNNQRRRLVLLDLRNTNLRRWLVVDTGDKGEGLTASKLLLHPPWAHAD